MRVERIGGGIIEASECLEIFFYPTAKRVERGDNLGLVLVKF
jgi:hypothetical protein